MELFSLLPLDVFTDRDNYLNYAENSLLIFKRYQGGVHTLLANEPLWLLANVGFATFPIEMVCEASFSCLLPLSHGWFCSAILSIFLGLVFLLFP